MIIRIIINSKLIIINLKLRQYEFECKRHPAEGPGFQSAVPGRISACSWLDARSHVRAARAGAHSHHLHRRTRTSRSGPKAAYPATGAGLGSHAPTDRRLRCRDAAEDTTCSRGQSHRAGRCRRQLRWETRASRLTVRRNTEVPRSLGPAFRCLWRWSSWRAARSVCTTWPGQAAEEVEWSSDRPKRLESPCSSSPRT